MRISLSKILKNYFSVLSVRRDRSESTVQAEECRIFPRSDLDQKYLLSASRSLRVRVFKHCQRYATVFSVRCSKSLQWFNLQACEVSQKHRRTHGAEGPSLITWSFTPGEPTLTIIHPIMNADWRSGSSQISVILLLSFQQAVSAAEQVMKFKQTCMYFLEQSHHNETRSCSIVKWIVQVDH